MADAADLKSSTSQMIKFGMFKQRDTKLSTGVVMKSDPNIEKVIAIIRQQDSVL